MKEEWARLICGNIGRVGKKRYEDWSCRICGKEDESMNHIWMREDEWVKGVSEWRKGKIEGELTSRLLRQLQEVPVPACTTWVLKDVRLWHQGQKCD